VRSRLYLLLHDHFYLVDTSFFQPLFISSRYAGSFYVHPSLYYLHEDLLSQPPRTRVHCRWSAHEMTLAGEGLGEVLVSWFILVHVGAEKDARRGDIARELRSGDEDERPVWGK